MKIKKMVNRFLCWSLPKDFAPDAGISFKEGALWPTGTNLLHAGQAEEMFRYCLSEPTTFQERVIAEKEELDGKLESLRAFFPTELCLGLPFAERERLKRQEQAMTAYSAVLGQRISAFDCQVPDEPVGAEQGTVPASDADIEQQIQANGLTFGLALEALQRGYKLARAGWNGKGMFIYYVPANAYPVQTGAAKSHFGDGSLVPYNAYLAIKNVNETVSTWVPSINDVLAEDWTIVH